MDILFIVKKWEGGVGNVVKGYEKYLNRLGHKVYTLSREDDLECYSFVSSIRKLRKAVNKRDYDRIITNDWSLALPLLFPWPVKHKNHYSIFHGEQPGITSMIQGYIGWMMETFGRLIVVGPKLKERFKLSKRVDNGVDLEVFKPSQNPEFDADNVGFANWPTEFYHYGEIYDACEIANKEFILAEDLNKKQMANFYNKLNYFISLPGDITGYNLVWAEALACGVPKIIGNNAGIGPELPIHRIEEFTPESIAKAIKEAPSITPETREKFLKQISLERATHELIKALDLEDEKSSKEEKESS